MADGMYVGMSGAAARAEQLESVADNLANSQTTGFKASRPAFETFLPENAQGELAYTAAVDSGIDLRPGDTTMTGRPNDVMPSDGAFLVVGLSDGTVGYTRDGRLQTNSAGQLLAGKHPVLGIDGKPILVPPGEGFSVNPQGAVLSGGREMGRLGLCVLQGPMVRKGDSVLVPKENAGSATPVETTVRTGELELSNSGPLEAAVQMITTQRSYDTSMQAIATYRRMDEQASAVGRSK